MGSKVGVRELKQNASAVLRRVKAGEAVEITERGLPVALLVPIPESGDVIERLVAEGQATAGEGNLTDLPPPTKPPKGALRPSEVLAELRADER